MKKKKTYIITVPYAPPVKTRSYNKKHALDLFEAELKAHYPDFNSQKYDKSTITITKLSKIRKL